MTKRMILGAAALLAAAAVACSSGEGGSSLGGSSGGGASGPSGCPKDDPECREAATVEQGQGSVRSRKCVDCHGSDMSGSARALEVASAGSDVKLYPPNLTNDKDTGIGAWTDEQLALAIRSGVDEESLQLCPQMNHFSTMSDYEVFSIVKYLRSLPAVRNPVPRSVCPPLKQ
jgi:mono/diheme cytochrome c family protein